MKYHNIPTLFDNQASLINGKNIGTDSVRYIQDAGQKVAGTTYIDKNTNELYVCVTTTNSVNNDGNFSKFNLKEAFNKLDNLKYFDLVGLAYCGKSFNGLAHCNPIPLKQGATLSNTVVVLGLTSQKVDDTMNAISYVIQNNTLIISSTINPNTQSDRMSYAVKYIF